MALNPQTGNMYKFINHTWNTVIGEYVNNWETNERAWLRNISKGKKGTTCYAISRNSLIINFLESLSQSLSLNHGDWVG